MSVEQAIQAQRASQGDLLRRANVVGVAVGNKGSKEDAAGEKAVVVLVERKLPLAALTRRDRVPGAIDGVRTDVYEVGYLRALATPRDRFRPTMPAGVSMGHYRITAGTLGAMVIDRFSGERLILSNNHVLANANDARAGDVVLQPAPRDGGRNPADVVAHLERFIPLRFIGEPPPPPEPVKRVRPAPDAGRILRLLVNMINLMNEMSGSDWRVQTAAAPGSALAAQRATLASDNHFDAALARPVQQGMFTNELRGVGLVRGTRAPALGMAVRKTGRTTDHTIGKVVLLNATVNVAYGKKTARFTGQVITSPMSLGGDSGSLIVHRDERVAVGLLFAGSTQATIFTPIQPLLDALDVTLVEG